MTNKTAARYTYKIYHNKQCTVKEQLSNVDAVSVMKVYTPVELGKEYEYMSRIVVKPAGSHTFKDLDQALEDLFPSVWFDF